MTWGMRDFSHLWEPAYKYYHGPGPVQQPYCWDVKRVFQAEGMLSLCKKLGNPRVFNLIVLGAAAQHMDFSKQEWYDVIEKTVPQKTIEINKKAFDVGYGL